MELELIQILNLVIVIKKLKNLAEKKVHYHKFNKDIYHKRGNDEGLFSSLKRTILHKIVSK